MQRYLVIGMGAIGTYLGGSLLASGAKVGFVERADLIKSRLDHPVKLLLPRSEIVLSGVPIFPTIPDAFLDDAWDAVLVAVKTFDTAALLPALDSEKAKIRKLVSLQNGIGNESLYADVLGWNKILPASITTAVGKKDDGTVIVEKFRGIALAANCAESGSVLEDFQSAGLNPQVVNNWKAMKWSKLLTNLQANACSAILNMPPKDLFQHSGVFQLEMRMLNEALQVMRKLNIPVMNLPKTPVRALQILAQQVPPRLGQFLSEQFLGKGRGAKMPSLQIDLSAGRERSEVDDLNGAVVKEAAAVGLRAPVNAFYTLTLKAMISGDVAFETYHHRPDRLVEDFYKYLQKEESCK